MDRPRHARFPAALACVLGVAFAGCIASAPEGIQRRTDGSGGAGGDDFETTHASASVSTGAGTDDPHSVFGADPPHGPFSGGTRVVVKGKGFEPDARVWFGDEEATDVVAIDPTHLQVHTPPHDPGAVELVTQNGDDDSTRRTLPAGYTYDALFAEPDEGPVAGGTVIEITSKGTSWDTDFVEARVDQKPCTTVEVLAPDRLRCTTPKGTPGTKSIGVETSEGTTTALDAFTYQDSSDGFKGGLGGDPIAGKLRVLAFDNFTGDPLEGAHVVVGEDVQTALYAQVGPTGVVEITDASLNGPVTVTVAASCHSPITFADVPVDTVTTYLDPVLTPQCASDGDPPPGGGNSVLTGQVDGQLVWPKSQEFQKGKWSNVPAPGPNEERRAYVFFATRNRRADFSIPSPTYEVTESDPGNLGYGFSVPYVPGNHEMYALAGLRDLSTGAFSAYAFGAVEGVAVEPGETTENVIIPMDHPLDQALTMNVTPPPASGDGPDRLDARVVIELAPRRYAILPGMHKTPLLPLSGALKFVGLPPLDADLTGNRYIASASAVTGPSLNAPLSDVRDAAATTTALPIEIDGYVAVPELLEPAEGGGWNGTALAVDYPAGGFPADLTVYEIAAAGGLWRWIVAVPAAAHSQKVPDLSGFPEAHLPDGPLTIGVYGGRLEDFDYGTIGYRNLRGSGMDAYALDYFNAHL